MTKYKEQVQTMLDSHPDLFKEFKILHDEYEKNPKAMQEKFNAEGQKVLHLIKRFETNLCSKSESTKYGKYSAVLADKFWREVRLVFPKIDCVGMR